KQSIYRFRRADVAQWQALRALVASGDGGEARLSVSFRSVPGVVGFVNRAFAAYPGYEPLVASRGPAELAPVVALEAATADDTDDAVVRYLLTLVAGEGRVADRATGALRRPRFGDVMVLLPSWTAADALHESLSAAGIPSVVEGGRVFFQRDEVRLCRAALRAIDEPGDAQAVVFVLRGLFGLSLAELASHRAAGGAWRYTLATDDAPEGPVTEALRVLADLARRRGERGLVELLDDLLEETGVLAVWSLLPRGRAMLANVDKLRALCRELLGHVRTGFELNARLDALAREPDEDLPLAGPDADVVRVTTIFKAKGLEAPVVVLPHMTRRSRPPAHIVDRARGELLLRWRQLEPPGWDDAKARDDAEDAAERRRWMYVAAT
ncbi:MAG: hypothetical protein KC635_29085, partial [Myxococcales bacterium]|nr:hypothetical protein [Myxococcales bacterium]